MQAISRVFHHDQRSRSGSRDSDGFESYSRPADECAQLVEFVRAQIPQATRSEVVRRVISNYNKRIIRIAAEQLFKQECAQIFLSDKVPDSPKPEKDSKEQKGQPDEDDVTAAADASNIVPYCAELRTPPKQGAKCSEIAEYLVDCVRQQRQRNSGSTDSGQESQVSHAGDEDDEDDRTTNSSSSSEDGGMLALTDAFGHSFGGQALGAAAAAKLPKEQFHSIGGGESGVDSVDDDDDETAHDADDEDQEDEEYFSSDEAVAEPEQQQHHGDNDSVFGDEEETPTIEYPPLTPGGLDLFPTRVAIVCSQVAIDELASLPGHCLFNPATGGVLDEATPCAVAKPWPGQLSGTESGSGKHGSVGEQACGGVRSSGNFWENLPKQRIPQQQWKRRHLNSSPGDAGLDASTVEPIEEPIGMKYSRDFMLAMKMKSISETSLEDYSKIEKHLVSVDRNILRSTSDYEHRAQYNNRAAASKRQQMMSESTNQDDADTVIVENPRAKQLLSADQQGPTTVPKKGPSFGRSERFQSVATMSTTTTCNSNNRSSNNENDTPDEVGPGEPVSLVPQWRRRSLQPNATTTSPGRFTNHFNSGKVLRPNTTSYRGESGSSMGNSTSDINSDFSPRSVRILGRGDPKACGGLSGVPVRCRVFAGRFNPTTTPEMVMDYLRSKSIEVFDVREVTPDTIDKTRFYYRNFIVTLSRVDLPQVQDPMFWPRNILCREITYRRPSMNSSATSYNSISNNNNQQQHHPRKSVSSNPSRHESIADVSSCDESM